MRMSIIFLMFLKTSIFFSQNLIIELNIEWQRETDPEYFIIDKSFDSLVPYLKITYKNLSERDLYFLKYNIKNKNLAPDIIDFCDKEYSKFNTDSIKNTSLNDYNVVLNAFFLEMYGNHKLESSCDLVVNSINQIYANLWVLKNSKSFSNIKETYNYYNKFSLDTSKKLNEKSYTETEISEQAVNLFLFLKKGDVFEEYINLIGFKIIGGTYEFELASYTDYLLFKDQIQDIDRAGLSYKKKFFPKKINNFVAPKVINKNSVKIEF